MAPGVPQWLEIPPLRKPLEGVEPTLADVVSRLQSPETYRDARHVTYSHEGTHGLNAQLRNQRIELEVAYVTAYQGSATERKMGPHVEVRVPRPAGVLDPAVKLGNVNAFYVLGGRGLRLPEPACQLRDVAEDVPLRLCGMAYQLYLVQQRRYWNDQPLYVFDEWSAYLNGLQTALDTPPGDGATSDLVQALEFLAYGSVLLKIVKTRVAYPVPNWLALRDFYCWQAERTLRMYELCQGTLLASDQSAQYRQALLDETILMDFIAIQCGTSWWEEVFNGREWFGVF